VANTSTEVRDRAEQTAATAVGQSRELGRDAREAGADLVDGARDQVGAVATEIRDQARQVVDDTRSRLQSQADSQRSQLAEALGAFGGELRALVDGRPDEAGTAGRYVEQVGGAVGELATQIRERDFAGIVDDVQRFARRRPGVFLAAVAATGFVAGRLARSTTDDRARTGTADGGEASTALSPALAPVAPPDQPVGPEPGGTGTSVP
jgi:hypothetical protein